jgi:hypothetical protein
VNGFQPENIDIGPGGVHVDSEDLPNLIQALSKFLAFLASVGLLAIAALALWKLEDTSGAMKVAVLALGLVLGLTGVLLVIALLLPNAPVTRTVFNGVIGITKAILTPFLKTSDKTPVDPKKHRNSKTKPVSPKAKVVKKKPA